MQSTMPCDEHLETLALCAILTSPKDMSYAMSHLTHDDFYLSRTKNLWNTMSELYSNSQEIDLITLTGEHPKKQEVDYIVTACSEQSHLLYGKFGKLVKQLRTYTQKRKLTLATRNILMNIQKLSNPKKLVESCLLEIQSSILESTISVPKNAHEIMSKQCKEWDKYIDSTPEEKERYRGFRIGFDNLDDIIGGITPEMYCILAANPSVGKTTFALNIVQNLLMKKKHVLFFSLEMSAESLVEKFYNLHAGGNIKAQLDNGYNKDIVKQNLKELQYLDNLTIISRGNTTVTNILSEIEQMKHTHEIALVVIDYIGLITPENQAVGRVQQVSVQSRMLAQATKDLQVPILCLSQLSRDNQKRTGKSGVKRPVLSDLRDSGSLEQDADIVIMLHNERYQEVDTMDCRFIEAWVRKNRTGSVGGANLLFFPKNSKFTSNKKNPLPGEDADENIENIMSDELVF